MKSTWFRLAALILTTALPLRPVTVQAQALDTVTVGAKRAMVTRAELQASLSEIDRGLTSSVYSQSIKTAKLAEADAIRERLTEGDFHPGDEIKVDLVPVDAGLSATYTVSSARTITLPGNTEIPMRGVLRSEVQAFLTKAFTRYVVDPTLTATPLVRVSFFGGVGKPGFVTVEADMLLSASIMKYGGGISNNARMEKSQILRNNKVVVDGPEFSDALYRGRTLDQLNVQAGDEIRIALKPASGLFWRVVGAVSGLTGLIYLFTQLTR